MTVNGWLQIGFFLLAILAVTPVLGRFMVRVFTRERTWLDPVLRPIERLVFTPKVELDMVVHDEDVDGVVRAIICAARTGRCGDGHVSVMPVEHRYEIRTGARDVS